jgi:hypothetical protein
MFSIQLGVLIAFRLNGLGVFGLGIRFGLDGGGAGGIVRLDFLVVVHLQTIHLGRLLLIGRLFLSEVDLGCFQGIVFPTIGSILGVLPPALYALAQSDGGMGLALLSLGVIGGIQLIMGNYIDPLVQGRVLSLSPLIVLFSVAFWGWMWGVAGAFIGVPITIATVLICRRFESTRWIATLLAETEDSRALPVVDDLRLDKHHRENASRTSSESEADRGSVDQVASSS